MNIRPLVLLLGGPTTHKTAVLITPELGDWPLHNQAMMLDSWIEALQEERDDICQEMLDQVDLRDYVGREENVVTIGQCSEEIGPCEP